MPSSLYSIHKRLLLISEPKSIMAILCSRPHRARRRPKVLLHTTATNVFCTDVPPSEDFIPLLRQRVRMRKQRPVIMALHQISSFCRVSSQLLQLAFFLSMLFLLLHGCTGHPVHDDSTTMTTGVAPATQHDFVCNADNERQCVCARFEGNLDGKLIECSQFLGIPSLEVVKITLKKVNLEARLHTNETYQEYFRRRVANIVSQYCEQEANECPGTPLQMPKENIIILRVNFLPRNLTDIYFVVTKDRVPGKLHQSVLMEPSKIKYILSAQIGPLSRVLGGIRIVGLQLDTIKRHANSDNEESNTRLVIIVSVIIGLFLICYCFAAFKIIRENLEKRRRQRALQAHETQKYGPNYGTCVDHCEKTNGKVKTRSIASRESISSGRKGTKHSDARTPIELVTPTIEEDHPSLDARSFQRMFACDPSQLPAEIHVTSSNDLAGASALLQAWDGSHATHQPPLTTPPQEMPSVILIESGSISDVAKNLVSAPKIQMEPNPEAQTRSARSEAAEEASSSLLAAATFPFERPLSRRGSRNSTPEDGLEEFTYNREETPVPLGDAESSEFPLINKPRTILVEQWSSDSESENEVYERLPDVSDGEEEDEKITDEQAAWNRKRNHSSDAESNYSEEEKDEEDVLDRHQYERLQESPIPAKVIPQTSIEFDSAVEYQ